MSIAKFSKTIIIIDNNKKNTVQEITQEILRMTFGLSTVKMPSGKKKKKIVFLTFKFAPTPWSTDLLFSSLSPRDKIMPIPSFGLRLKSGETCQKEEWTNQSTVEMEVKTLVLAATGLPFLKHRNMFVTVAANLRT